MELEVEMLHLVSDGVGGDEGGKEDERKRMQRRGLAQMEEEVKDDAWAGGRLLLCERCRRSMAMDNAMCEETDSEGTRKRGRVRRPSRTRATSL